MVKRHNLSSKYKNLFTNTIIFAISNLSSKIILFLLVPLYTNVLSTNEYGIIEIIVSISNITISLVS